MKSAIMLSTRPPKVQNVKMWAGTINHAPHLLVLTCGRSRNARALGYHPRAKRRKNIWVRPHSVQHNTKTGKHNHAYDLRRQLHHLRQCPPTQNKCNGMPTRHPHQPNSENHLEQQSAPAEAKPRGPQGRPQGFACRPHQQPPGLAQHSIGAEAVRDEQRWSDLPARYFVGELVARGISREHGLEGGAALKGANEVGVPAARKRGGGGGREGRGTRNGGTSRRAIAKTPSDKQYLYLL